MSCFEKYQSMDSSRFPKDEKVFKSRLQTVVHDGWRRLRRRQPIILAQFVMLALLAAAAIYGTDG